LQACEYRPPPRPRVLTLPPSLVQLARRCSGWVS
jgi:hypothetical protein